MWDYPLVCKGVRESSLSSGVKFRNGNEQKVHLRVMRGVDVLREESLLVKNCSHPGDIA